MKTLKALINKHPDVVAEALGGVPEVITLDDAWKIVDYVNRDNGTRKEKPWALVHWADMVLVAASDQEEKPKKKEHFCRYCRRSLHDGDPVLVMDECLICYDCAGGIWGAIQLKANEERTEAIA